METGLKSTILIMTIAWGFAELILGWRAFNARPNREILNKYPYKVLFAVKIPFIGYWRKYVIEEEINIFEKYQRRNTVLFFNSLIPLLGLICLLLYVLIKV